MSPRQLDTRPSAIPAPERDLKNVSPKVSLADDTTSPVTRAVFGSLAVGFGITIVIMAIAVAIFQASPLPSDMFDVDEITAAFLAGLTGLCLIGCGVGIYRCSLLTTSLLFFVALLCGLATTLVS
ncbi:MAG: hypothetical protein KDA86_08940 [Planctomycetaceae bacterium]|nr:hypothetical protein [Planctomycetaceae bacterium]